MPDKKISQLTERLTTAATDVFPVVYVGATDTEKVKASTIYTYIKTTLVSGIIQATTDTDKFLVQDGTEIKYRTGSEMLGDILPTQTGNAGKVLKTDGTTATWQVDATSSSYVALPFTTDHLTATGNQYLVGDVVYYLGNVYICIANNDSILPTSTLYWTLLGAGNPLIQQPIDWNSTSGNNQILNKPTIPTTPTLQQVTDVGLQTNDSIKLENGFDIYDGANAQWIEARGGDNFVALRIAGALQEFFVAEIGQVVIKDGVNKSAIVGISNIPASTTKTYQLPNMSVATATLVTSVNGTSAGANGDVSISVAGTQDLQSVTTNGNTTTDEIYLGQDGVGLYDPFATDHMMLTSSNTTLFAKLLGSVNTIFETGLTELKFGEIIKAIFNNTLLTASRTYNLPNANGTLVLSVNGTSPNSLGEITIPVGSQTLDQTTALGNTSNQNIVLENGAFLEIEDTTALDLLQFFVTANAIYMQYSSSGDRLFELDNNRFSWGNQNTANWVQFRNSNLSTASVFEMPDDSGATFATKVNGVSANAQGEITIPTGASLNLQQVTDNGNTTTNDIALIDASVTGIDNLDFDLTPATTTHSEGRVRWNDSDKTLQIDTEQSGVSISVGHDLIQRVVNNTGSTLNKGTIVYINGQQGGRPTVTPADYTLDATSARTLGIIMDAIPNNQNGYVITNGLLSGINTSTYTAGQQLYLGASGALTGTKPIQPLHAVYVAKVVSVGLLGSVFVDVQNVLELEELHDVLITSPINNQVLVYDAVSTLWKNKSIPERRYKLGFNNISDYVVNGGSGTQNLGNILGMSVTQNLQELLYSVSGTNLVINAKVIAAEQYGGVTNEVGIRVTYGSTNGATFTDYLVNANYVYRFGSNFALQWQSYNIVIPQQYAGATTEYFQFDVIVRRNSGGSTSVYASELIFTL